MKQPTMPPFDLAHGPEPVEGKWLNVWTLSVGPLAVGTSALLCLFFLFSTTWNSFGVLLVPPSLLYLCVALVYWLGYRQVNKADKLATLAATTAIYLFPFVFCGLVRPSPHLRTLALLVLLAIMAGAFEMRRWRRRLSYLPLGILLVVLAITWLLNPPKGPPVLYLPPTLLLHQALLLLALCLPAELSHGGAGDPPPPSTPDLLW